MEQTRLPLPHKLTLSERKNLTVSGVTEVVSFDETAVVAHTELGTLVIQGQGLQLKTLSPEGGHVVVEGTIGALHYVERSDAGGWLRRLFG